MIQIDELTVMQSGFRNPDQIKEMISHVADGGVFDNKSLLNYSNGKKIKPISLVRFEDDRVFIHDGHHRVAAVYLGGRKYLSYDEYEIKNFKYEDYLAINLSVGWITPFDPRTEVRIPDYSSFKEYFNVYIKNYGEAVALSYIEKSKHYERYSRVRTVLTIQDLLRHYEL